MYIIYNAIVLFFVLILLPIILLALVSVPKFRAGFFQKCGCYKNISTKKKHIVIHAVSVGEVIAVEKFVKTLRENYNDAQITLTTITKTGNAVAKQKLSSVVDNIIYFPFDLFFAVNSFIKNVKPDLVIIAETEIWPYFSYALKKNNIPIIIINGRISPHSHKGYKKFRWFFKKVLANYTKILMQTFGDKERITDIGANTKITEVMGNLKFDITNNLSEKNINELKSEFALSTQPMLIAGSTHKGEDEKVLNLYKNLLKEVGNLKLILAPRHPERLADVENLLQSQKLIYGKRSNKDTFAENQVILLDTMGELSKLYAISTVAFIGGSFSGTGGHNPLEAAIFNVPVVSGNSTFNFKDIYKYLTNDNAAFVVENEEELFNITKKLLTDKDFYASVSNACQKVFKENCGAINNAMNTIKELV